MGTINYGTSDYITLGIKPYDADDFREETSAEYGQAIDLVLDFVKYILDGVQHIRIIRLQLKALLALLRQ